ncbi:MAG TPA: DUF1127 domain-containing protein [Thiolinea sp.]|nr:DUF1127 domain-containing protein [Thiolinea sp.]
MNMNTSLPVSTLPESTPLWQGASDHLFRLRQYLLHQQAEWCLRQALRRERQALASLPPHLLRDIGVTPAEAVRESRCAGIPAARRQTLLPL